MKSLSILLVFAQLSVQLPHAGVSPPLVSRGHTYSPYSSDIKRLGSGSIIDNERVKFLLPITFGDQTLDAELDTGSSDTWLIRTGYLCYNTFNLSSQSFVTAEPPGDCNFGPTYTPGPDFTPIPGIFEESCYGSESEGTSRCVVGPFGTTSVTICGLTIPQQVVGAPDLVSYARETNCH